MKIAVGLLLAVIYLPAQLKQSYGLILKTTVEPETFQGVQITADINRNAANVLLQGYAAAFRMNSGLAMKGKMLTKQFEVSMVLPARTQPHAPQFIVVFVREMKADSKLIQVERIPVTLET